MQENHIGSLNAIEDELAQRSAEEPLAGLPEKETRTLTRVLPFKFKPAHDLNPYRDFCVCFN